MRPLLLACAVALTAAAGCKSDPAPPSGEASAPTACALPSAMPPPGPSAYKDDDLPVAPDFELAAAKEITADNYKEKLAEIVAEISGREVAPAASASAAPK